MQLRCFIITAEERYISVQHAFKLLVPTYFPAYSIRFDS